MRKLSPTLLAIGLIAATPPVPTAKPLIGPWSPVMGAFCFPSGLRLVLQEDHTLPLVAVATVHQGGSGDDPAGAEGTAHLAEHLWFRTHRGESDVTDELERVGAAWNAFTEPDTTRFETVVPRAALPTVLRLEAARMSEGLASLTDADVAAERSIVVSEGNFGARPLASLLQAAISSAQFAPGHPYRWSPPSSASIGGISRETLVRWAETRWRPAETTVVVAGDFVVDGAWAAVNRLFPPQVLGLAADEPFHPGSCPVRLPAQRPEPALPVSTELVHVAAPVRQQTLVVSWALPGGLRTGEAEMHVLAAVLQPLAQYYVSRLVVDERADEAVSCAVYPRALATTLTCAVEVDTHRTPERVRRAISTAASDLRGDAAARVTYSEAFGAAWRAQQADWFGSSEALTSIGEGRTALVADYVHHTGSPTYTRDHMAWGDAVTGESIEALAKAWLKADRQVAVVLDPTPASVAVETGERALLAGPRGHGAVGPADAATLRARMGLPPLEERAEKTLPNGLRIAALRLAGAPILRVGLAYGGAERAAPNLAIHLLTELGTQVRFASGEDMKLRDANYLYGRAYTASLASGETTLVEVPAGNLENGLFMLRDRVRHERFETTTANHDAREVLDRVRAADDPYGLEDDAAWQVFAPGDERLASGVGSLVAAADAASPAAAAEWYAAFHQPANAAVVMVGDIDPVAAVARAEAWFADWKVKAPSAPPVARPAVVTRPGRMAIVLADPMRTSTTLTLRCATDATPGAERVLAERLEAAVYARIREQRGISYAVEGDRAEPLPGLHGIVVGTTVETDAVAEALRSILDEIGAVARGLDAAELDRARLRIATDLGHAGQPAWRIFTHVTDGTLEGSSWGWTDAATALAAVTAPEVTAAAASCSGHEVIVLRGPEAPIRAAVAAVGVATKP